jgi:hypothetical protein
MATKIMVKNTMTAKVKTNVVRQSAARKNGEKTPSEHLEKANKAMTKAWTLIARRKAKRG